MELVGISLFGSSLIGFLLFFTHILGCLTVGFLFRFWKKNKEEKISYNTSKSENKLQNITVSSLGEVLGESISSAISTILMIGGFVVLLVFIINYCVHALGYIVTFFVVADFVDTEYME